MKRLDKKTRERVIDAVIQSIYAVSGRTDPLIRQCSTACRHDLMFAIPFLTLLGLSNAEIAMVMNASPTAVIDETMHLVELKEQDPKTLQRKLKLISNGVRERVGIPIPVPVMAGNH